MRRLILFVLPWICFQTMNADEPGEKAYKPLFNGMNLDGWQQFGGKEKNWLVEKGLIVCQGQGGGWLGTDRDYANFELQVDYRLTPGGNSGIYLRAPQEGHISRAGMEIQLLDDFHPKYANLDFYQYTGSIYHVVAPTRRTTRKAGEWNSMVIRAEGDHIVVTLNQVKIVDADLAKCRQDPAVAKEHPGLARKSGRLGLQSHTDRVEFRNLRILELKP